MLAFGSAVEPYRAANVTSGKELYRWTFLSDDGAQVLAGNGIALTPDKQPDLKDRFDRIFVCGGVNTQLYKPEHSVRWLQHHAQNGTCMGSVSTGAWLLAHAGLLQGHRCTLHWQSLDAFREAYPDVQADPSVYVVEDNRSTCCGGSGAFDMMVHIIAEDHGDEIVTDVCNWLFHDRIRMPTDVQGIAQHTALARKSPKPSNGQSHRRTTNTWRNFCTDRGITTTTGKTFSAPPRLHTTAKVYGSSSATCKAIINGNKLTHS